MAGTLQAVEVGARENPDEAEQGCDKCMQPKQSGGKCRVGSRLPDKSHRFFGSIWPSKYRSINCLCIEPSTPCMLTASPVHPHLCRYQSTSQRRRGMWLSL